MIDLHLHTTASDGRSAPAALVREAYAAGCRTMAVTDHDTVAGLADAAREALSLGATFVNGIEMTAVHERRDVHILGYFIEPTSPRLETFLVEQRRLRRERLVAMAQRLASAGAPLDVDQVLDLAPAGKALGRPALAIALVGAGYARDVADAFDRFLAEGRPGFVTRDGASPAAVIDEIRRAGGIASMAHPGKFRQDAIIAPMVEAGLQAIEVFHPDHTPDDVERYRGIADAMHLVATGGSDYHGPGSGRTEGLGRVTLPARDFEALCATRRAVDPR